MAQLTLTLLGGFEARLSAGRPVALPRKVQALVAYLALAAKPLCPRTELATLLWGNTGRVQAQQNLRQTLAVLRRELDRPGRSIVKVDAVSIGLDRAAVEVDALRFEDLVKKGSAESLAQAAAMYRGDLLAGLEIDEEPFDDWLRTQRERRHELAINGLTQLLGHQSKGRALDAAVQTASRLLAFDPLHEPAHRALMRLYLAQGRRPAALRQYQTCVGVLQRELGVEPAAETKKVYAELLREGSSGASGVAAARTGAQARVEEREHLTVAATATPFVGRATERARLRKAMAAAFAGHGQVVAITGEAGIGKSRLVEQTTAEAAQRGARVLVGRGYRTEQILPLGPWRQALRDSHVLEDPEVGRRLRPTVRAELARLVPGLAAAPSSAPGLDDAARLFDAMTALFDALTAVGPVAVVLEDLQWADDMTLRLLSVVCRRQHTRRILTMVTVTDEETVDAPALGDLLGDLDHERLLVRISLDALSRDETATLVRALARAAGEPVMTELAAQVWAASEGHPFMVVETLHAVAEGSTAATPVAVPLPERVREVVAARLDRVSEGSRGLLAVASVIGRDVDFTLLHRAAGLDEAAAAGALEELVTRRVLRVVGERFEFTHNRIREIAYGRLLPPRRRLLHRQTFEALRTLHAAALEPHAAALGTHAYEGELWPEAAEHFRRAGQWALARSFNREAVASFERAVASLDRVVGVDTTALAIDLRLELRTALVLIGEVEQAHAPLEQARSLAKSLGDPLRLGRVWTQVSSQRWWTGHLEEALAAAETAAQHASETSDHDLGVAATICRAYAHFGMGDYREVPRILDPLLSRLGALERDRYGQHQLPIVSPSNQVALALAHCGDFDAALVRGADNVARAEALDHRYGLTHTCWALGEIHVHRACGVEAIAPLERALGLFPDRADFFLYGNVLGALGYAHVLAGDVDAGLGMMHEALAGREQHPLRVGLTRLMARTSEALLIAGRLAGAREVAGRCLALTREHGERGYEAWARCLLGEIAAHGGAAETDAARTHFAEAMAIAEPREMRPVVAHCHFGLGRLLGSADHLAAATAMYREMGMQRWLDQAEGAR